MRKLNFAIAGFFLVFVISSCQREVDGTLPEQPPVSSKDPAALSASLKVWHGTRTTGTPPAPTRNTPAIDPTANPTVYAIAGRYAIIKPEITAGNVAGYYLGVPNSGQYFKVDFSKPRNIAGRGIKPKRSGFIQRGQGIQDGTADSSIVIVLPPNINAPDTFCVTYCPYDSSGNIGQPVTTCIYVSSFGASANDAWLMNDFKITASWEDSSGVRINKDTFLINKWAPINAGYYCDQTFNPPVLQWGAIYQGITPIVSDSIKYTKYNLRFALNGAFDFQDIEQEKDINLASTCSQFVFNPITNYTDTVTGAYNYSATTNKLILVFEFDGQGIPDPEYWAYDLTKINNNQFILKDPIDNFFIRFER